MLVGGLVPLPWLVSLTLGFQYDTRELSHPLFLSLYRNRRKPGSSPCSFSLWAAARRSLQVQGLVGVARGSLRAWEDRGIRSQGEGTALVVLKWGSLRTMESLRVRHCPILVFGRQSNRLCQIIG